MLKIKNTVKDYNIGNSKIELKFLDLFTDIKNGLVLNTKPTFCSVSNVGIVKDIELFTDKITFVPTKQIRTSNKVYNCIIKISANVPKLNTAGQFDSTLGTVDKYYYIKIKLCPKIDGTDSELYVEAYEKLSPDQYQADKQHEKDNLDALVSKKALINNLKEFGNQVKNKIANTHKYEIKYDLAGGFWPDNNEGRHTFCNAEAYSPLPPEKNGYTFKGWQLYKIGDETETPLIPESEIAVDNMIQVGTDYDVEAEAFWNPEVITINVRDEGSKIKGTVSIEYNENLILKDLIKGIAAPAKDCYILNGWEIKSSTYEKKVVFKDDIELYDLFLLNDYSTTIDLYPVYRPITAEIVFNFGIDTSIYLPNFRSKGNKYTYGQAFVLPVPHKLNYRFKGWIIKQKGKEGEPLLKNADTDDKLHFIIDAFELAGYDKDTKLELTPEFEKQYISINYHLSDSSLIPYMSGVDPTKYKTKFTRDELTTNDGVLLIKPVSVGFSFKNWELSAKDSEIFKIASVENEFRLKISDLQKFNTTEIGATIDLYAIWEAENVDVTVEIWGESLTSIGKYTKSSSGVVESDTCTYQLFSPIILKDFKALQKDVTLGKIKEKAKPLFGSSGFELKKFRENEDKELIQIKPDGSTVVKLYYYRKEYEVRVNDTIKGGYLEESGPLKLKRIFKDGKMSEWKSILSTSEVEPGYTDYFTAKYKQTVKQEAEFIKGFNSDKSYGELILDCYSLPGQTIQSATIENNDIIFEFEYARKEFPITLNLNGYGYFGDISNPTYSVTNTVLANTKAENVLGKNNFAYKIYWVYNDVFHIPNKNEIITGPKVYNLEKMAGTTDENIWRGFKATSILDEANGVDKILNGSGLEGTDITETNIIDGLKFYRSKYNKKYTSFDSLKKINISNTKVGNYWLTNLNIHINSSSPKPTKIKNLDIEYFEKNIPSDAHINDVEVVFTPFVERLEPDIEGIITLSDINSQNFKVHGISSKDGASHVLVSLNNLNYENIINISNDCKKIESAIEVKRNSEIKDGTIIYFIAIKKIKKNNSDFFIMGKMYGARVKRSGSSADLENWQEVALPNITLKQNPYIISIKKNEEILNKLNLGEILFSEAIEDLILEISSDSPFFIKLNNNKLEHSNNNKLTHAIKISGNKTPGKIILDLKHNITDSSNFINYGKFYITIKVTTPTNGYETCLVENILHTVKYSIRLDNDAISIDDNIYIKNNSNYIGKSDEEGVYIIGNYNKVLNITCNFFNLNTETYDNLKNSIRYLQFCGFNTDKISNTIVERDNSYYNNNSYWSYSYTNYFNNTITKQFDKVSYRNIYNFLASNNTSILTVTCSNNNNTFDATINDIIFKKIDTNNKDITIFTVDRIVSTASTASTADNLFSLKFKSITELSVSNAKLNNGNLFTINNMGKMLLYSNSRIFEKPNFSECELTMNGSNVNSIDKSSIRINLLESGHVVLNFDITGKEVYKYI